ncbi:MAG: RHS repeat-associated core domain-containing protein, partial [Afipia sp.]|nr:RHS repeat-associated core domain-containing protein [Afipia sp.]
TTSGGGATSGNVFVPQAPEAFSHDLDGNVTSDGRWNYTWDAENRLIRLVARTGVGPQQRLDFAYDAQGRRIGKKVWPNTGGTGTPLLDRRFLYDGWNLVAELNATNNTVIRSYVWGLDLSGSEQGAGGVGGLLVVKPTGANALFPAYDGNGNVMGLVDGTTGTVTAQYEYGPFGELIRVSGAAAASNPFRFSTKYTDEETDLVYYGYRYYVPSTGRWLSRDPIEESGGVNVYAILNNSAVVHRDYLGLSTSCDTKCGPAVTRTTQRVLQDVESAFIGWDTVKKLTACNRLHGYDGPIRGNPADYVGRLQLAQNAWDILELAYHTPEIYDQAGYVSIQPFGEPERCKFTVAFAGRCYFASQVNYILWGRMHRLCNNTFGQLPEHRGEWSLDSALWYTTLWKTRKHGIPNTWSDEIREHVEQAMAFTRYGFDPAIRPEATACKDCRIQPGLVDDHQYHWTWLPYKTRDFVFWKPEHDETPQTVNLRDVGCTGCPVGLLRTRARLGEQSSYWHKWKVIHRSWRSSQQQRPGS